MPHALRPVRRNPLDITFAAIERIATDDAGCLAFFEAIRFPGGLICSACGADEREGPASPTTARAQVSTPARAAGGERELVTARTAGEETSPRSVPRESPPGSLSSTARGATKAIREAQTLEKSQAGDFVQGDLLDLGKVMLSGARFTGL